jgi:hypothetical protein
MIVTGKSLCKNERANDTRKVYKPISICSYSLIKFDSNSICQSATLTTDLKLRLASKALDTMDNSNQKKTEKGRKSLGRMEKERPQKRKDQPASPQAETSDGNMKQPKTSANTYKASTLSTAEMVGH